MFLRLVLVFGLEKDLGVLEIIVLLVHWWISELMGNRRHPALLNISKLPYLTISSCRVTLRYYECLRVDSRIYHTTWRGLLNPLGVFELSLSILLPNCGSETRRG